MNFNQYDHFQVNEEWGKALVKRVLLGAAIAAGVGLCTVVVLTVISGVQYRLAEDQGLDPGYAPTWIVAGTNLGLLIFALGALGALVVGIIALLQRRRLSRPRADRPTK
ncbi:hypothetical protein [Homoserinimonas sp. OAct 916]|uniref:hypothetical protein n=1 Tax=Homoserinimonas sp. OAct 916 TaxID=2211450 RepID=UPI0013004DCF|nr:hypothetical protein [Homoserinimonas sp. OAct 916]